MNYVRSIAKALAYLSVLAFSIWLAKAGLASCCDSPEYLPVRMPSDSVSYWFVGSSRVKSGINTELLAKHYKGSNFYNYGISGATFLSASMVASHLLQHGGSKVVFIEISPVIAELSFDTYRFTKIAGVDVWATGYDLLRHELNSNSTQHLVAIMSDKFFYDITASESLRRAWQSGFSSEGGSQEFVGYKSLHGNNFQFTTSFLADTDSEKYSSRKVDVEVHQRIIESLTNQAKSRGSKVIFFLPIAYKTLHEKRIVIPVHSLLPDSMKLTYPESFTREMTKAAFLFDINHLNKPGSDAYTRLLCPLIEKHIALAPEASDLGE